MGLFLFFSLIIIYLFIRFCWNWRVTPWPPKALDIEPIQVHRGYWIEGLQENSLEAFRDAKKRGARMIELDVHLASDQIPVVVHDDIIQGRNSIELFEQLNIPTLEAVLRDQDCPSKINIEIKSKSLFTNGIERAVCDTVFINQAQHRVLFSSFNPFCLMRLAKLAPDIPRALLVSDDKTDPKNKIYLRQMWFGFLAKPHMVNLNKNMFTPSLIKRLEERTIPTAAWTVNDETHALLLKNKGVVSIITDKFPLI